MVRRGANGIIMITTKRATAEGTKLEFGTSFGVNAGYMKNYDVMNTSQFISESNANNLKQDSGFSKMP